jgi:hypothetical protein
MPRTKGITSGDVIIIAQSKSSTTTSHDCLQYGCYHGVTLEAGMFLTTYYLSLLRVHQVHAEQDASPVATSSSSRKANLVASLRLPPE